MVDPRKRTIEVFVLGEGTYTLNGKFGTGQITQSRVLTGFTVAVDEVMV